MSLIGDGTNRKLNYTGKLHKARIVNFNLPAGITCPCRGECEKYCYAKTGNYTFSSTADSIMVHYLVSQHDEFTELMVRDLERLYSRAMEKGLEKFYVRLHDSGDFYSKEYLLKWVQIAQSLPHIMFYGYTKSISMVKSVALPANMVITFSHGSTEEYLISEDDRQAKVFPTAKDIPEGWEDGSEDDLVMFNSKKIALVAHGAKKNAVRLHY